MLALNSTTNINSNLVSSVKVERIYAEYDSLVVVLTVKLTTTESFRIASLVDVWRILAYFDLALSQEYVEKEVRSLISTTELALTAEERYIIQSWNDK